MAIIEFQANLFKYLLNDLGLVLDGSIGIIEPLSNVFESLKFLKHLHTVGFAQVDPNIFPYSQNLANFIIKRTPLI